MREVIPNFTILPCLHEDFESSKTKLRKYFPTEMSESDISDLNHLARTVGSNISIPFFVTRDDRLLSLEDDIYKEFHLSIIRPSDLIIRLDEIRQGLEYQPYRLAGTGITKKRIQSGEQEKLSELFLEYSQSERKSDFNRNLRFFLANPNNYRCYKVENKENSLLGFIVYEISENEIRVPIFRFRRDKLVSTLIRHFIFELCIDLFKDGEKILKITDKYLNPDSILALEEDGFFKIDEGWLKLILNIGSNALEISSLLDKKCNNSTDLNALYSPISNLLKQSDNLSESTLMSDIESHLFVKITDAEIPTFIIPIKPWWAKDLFDRELAEQVLWGAKEEIAFRRELVYYRSSKASGGLKAPGRILWYVSKDDDYYGVGAIRAISQIVEIIIDKPKNLYRRFRRLGVYTFKDVLKTANNDYQMEVMAIRFRHTELFKNPIEYKEVERIIDKKPQVWGPSKIDSEKFGIIYHHGMMV